MKTTYSFLLVSALALAASVSAQTITGYGVVKVYYGTQTSAVAFDDASAQPHSITAYVFGTGLTTPYSFTPSGGTQNGVVKDLTNDSTSGNFEQTFTSSSDLNTAYGDGAYTMAFPNNGGSGPQSALLQAFPGDDYIVPLVAGSWSGGRLQINSTAIYQLTFAGTLTGDDSIKLDIKDSGDNTIFSEFLNFTSNAGNNTFEISASLLTAGQTYFAELRFNNNFINYDTPFAGANGNIGYSVSNSFEIQAIPEPSTYAAIFGGLACLGVAFKRRRALAGGLFHRRRRTT